MRKNILLTGRPRVGKSTLIQRVVERLRQEGLLAIGGFYTAEMSRHGERVGFSINTLDGRIGRLAEIGLESRYRLGRYGIDMEGFEGIALTALEEAIRAGGLIVIDEIGYMELKSRRFRELVVRALDSPAPVLATILRSKSDFGDGLKARHDVELITVRVENRDQLVDEIVAKLLASSPSALRAHLDPRGQDAAGTGSP
jgi:nucleoside-triphosphatase THEP1